MDQDYLNEQMRTRGIKRYTNEVQKHIDNNQESNSGYSRLLIEQRLESFVMKVEHWKERAKAKAIRNGSAIDLLQKLPTDSACLITMMTTLNSVSRVIGKNTMCNRIGNAIDGEVRCLYLKLHAPKLFKKVKGQLDATTYDSSRKNFVIKKTMDKTEAGDGYHSGADAFVCATEAQKAKAGTVLLELFIESARLVEEVKYKPNARAKGSKKFIQALPETLKIIEAFNSKAKELNPKWLPTVERPKDWEDFQVGGYDSELNPNANRPLVQTASKKTKEELGAAVLPEILKVANTIQSTPWRVNTKVLEVAKYFYHSTDETICRLPAREVVLPPEIDLAKVVTHPEEFKDWKRKCADAHTQFNRSSAKRTSTSMTISIADEFKDEQEFYYPVFLDWRGRVYPLASNLEPQGVDLSKGLLEFANGKRIDTPEAVNWLAIHGANCFGVDKVSYADRIAWVYENEGQILECAKNPYENRWWTEADDHGWTFLAFCFEWLNLKTKGSSAVTHLPIAVDGSNNGLQILSLLGRDEVIADSTNVTPSKTGIPADIYGDVAKVMLETLKIDSSIDLNDYQSRLKSSEIKSRFKFITKKERESLLDGDDLEYYDTLSGVVTRLKKMATYWSKFGIDRKTAKRPVMTLAYGVSRFTTGDHLELWYEENVATKGEGMELEFIDKQNYCSYLNTVLWDAMDLKIKAPRKIMDWLKACAKLVTKNGLEVCWKTPLGLPVNQYYPKLKLKKVETSLGDKARLITCYSDIESELYGQKHVAGTAPNFVHSLDACALHQTTLLANQFGLDDLQMIHDSFATHCTGVDMLQAAIRGAYHSLFENDLLQDLASQLQAQLPDGEIIPELPTMGTLDISQLKDSEFFFS